MNITMSQIYWITRLDYIKDMLSFGLTIGSIATLMFMFLFAMQKVENNEPWVSKRDFLITVFISVFSGVVNVFVPTTKEMIVISVIPRVANVMSAGSDELVKQVKNMGKNKELQKLPNNAMSLVNSYLEEKVKEIKDK